MFMKGYSKCCDEKISLNGRCSMCGELATAKKYDCEICEDTGEVSCDERNSDGNWERGVGTQKCECRINNDDCDDQDD